MQKVIISKGFFVEMVSELVVNAVVVDRCDVRVKMSCDVLADSGFARQSRRGWWTAEHPVLGTVQWKSGVDFRTMKEYFLLRVNGRLLAKQWSK